MAKLQLRKKWFIWIHYLLEMTGPMYTVFRTPTADAGTPECGKIIGINVKTLSVAVLTPNLP